MGVCVWVSAGEVCVWVCVRVYVWVRGCVEGALLAVCLFIGNKRANG